MGKKNRPYDGPRVSLGAKTGYLRQQGAERYDINEYDTKYVDDEGNDTDANRDADIIKAMNNDFDLRSSQQYGKHAGLDGFKNLGNGLTDTHSAYNTHRAVVDHGTNEMGHKNVSSNSDYANITNDLFNKSQDKLIADATSNIDQEDEQSDAAVMPTTTYETSPETVKARETVKAWEASNSGSNVYGTNSSNASPAYGANSSPKRAISTNVDEFAQNFKNNVKDEMKFKSDIPLN